MSERWDIVIDQGATWRKAIVWSTDGNPVNLTSYTARMQLREQHTSPTPAVTLTSTGGGITITAGLGRLDLVIAASVTGQLTAGRYVYDLELGPAGGDITRLVYGWATVTPETTKDAA